MISWVIPGFVALAGLALAPSAQATCSAPARAATMVVTCPAIGAEQTFVVPAGLSTLHVVAVGGSGGFGDLGEALGGTGGAGGLGAVASGDVRVTAGSTLFVLVAGAGTSQRALPGEGGFNGGGRGGGRPGAQVTAGGGGGGASDVRTCSSRVSSCDTLASRLIVAAGGAGGGGGAFSNEFSEGGPGGDAGTDGAGADGRSPRYDRVGAALPGAGATRSAGGAGGPGAGAGARGTGGQGATADAPVLGSAAGGGGGGGLFGGGGGASSAGDTSAAGGGGGSSFGPPGATVSLLPQTGFLPGPASVTITYPVPAPPNVVVTRPHGGQVLSRFTSRAGARRRRPLVVSGRATDPSGVQGVAITIERLPRRASTPTRCTWLDGTRGATRASCDQPPTLIAKLGAKGTWTYRVPKRLKLGAGQYRVTAYGKGDSGVFGNVAPRRSRVVTFRLSRR